MGKLTCVEHSRGEGRAMVLHEKANIPLANMIKIDHYCQAKHCARTQESWQALISSCEAFLGPHSGKVSVASWPQAANCNHIKMQ